MATADKDKFVRFSTRGGASSYMGVAVHPSAIARYRPDAPNNKKMIDNGYMSEPFEMDDGDLMTCSYPACAGVFMLKDSPSDWSTHVAQRHTVRPHSPLGELQAQCAAKIAAYDQAAAAERDARERRLALEEEVAGLRKQLESMQSPEPVPVVATARKERIKA